MHTPVLDFLTELMSLCNRGNVKIVLSEILSSGRRRREDAKRLRTSGRMSLRPRIGRPRMGVYPTRHCPEEHSVRISEGVVKTPKIIAARAF